MQVMGYGISSPARTLARFGRTLPNKRNTYEAITQQIKFRFDRWQANCGRTCGNLIGRFYMRILGLVIFSSLALLFGCASYTPGVVPREAKALHVVELRALFERAASEALWFDDDVKNGLRFRFEPDGRMQVRSRFFTAKVVAGQWRLSAEPALLCIRVEQDPEACHTVYQLSGDRFYVDLPERAAETNTFTLRSR